jgi:hypothetical protein
VATVRFLSDWSQRQDDDIRAGGPLRIEYEPERLPHCRSYRYGQPSWVSIRWSRGSLGFVRLVRDPGGGYRAFLIVCDTPSLGVTRGISVVTVVSWVSGSRACG